MVHFLVMFGAYRLMWGSAPLGQHVREGVRTRHFHSPFPVRSTCSLGCGVNFSAERRFDAFRRTAASSRLCSLVNES